MVWPTTFQLLFHELFHLRKSLKFNPNGPCFMLLTYVATVGLRSCFIESVTAETDLHSEQQQWGYHAFTIPKIVC